MNHDFHVNSTSIKSLLIKLQASGLKCCADAHLTIRIALEILEISVETLFTIALKIFQSNENYVSKQYLITPGLSHILTHRMKHNYHIVTGEVFRKRCTGTSGTSRRSNRCNIQWRSFHLWSWWFTVTFRLSHLFLQREKL